MPVLPSYTGEPETPRDRARRMLGRIIGLLSEKSGLSSTADDWDGDVGMIVDDLIEACVERIRADNAAAVERAIKDLLR